MSPTKKKHVPKKDTAARKRRTTKALLDGAIEVNEQLRKKLQEKDHEAARATQKYEALKTVTRVAIGVMKQFMGWIPDDIGAAQRKDQVRAALADCYRAMGEVDAC